MSSLMDDPLFKAYMRKPPARHQANKTGEPWQLWVETPDHKWLTRTYGTYAEIWPTFVKRLRAGDDPTITSRRVFYAPPGEWYQQKVRKQRRPTPDDKRTSHIVVEWRWRQLFFWDATDLHWCGRCRRPVYWMPLHGQHHALRRMPAVTDEDNTRCLICGIRWVATPDIDHMEKIERMPA
jgi:hypothetical protein